MDQKTVEFKVGGMTCQGCVRSVEKKLSGMAGVESARVDLASGKAVVAFDGARVNTGDLKGAVEQIGFQIL